MNIPRVNNAANFIQVRRENEPQANQNNQGNPLEGLNRTREGDTYTMTANAGRLREDLENRETRVIRMDEEQNEMLEEPNPNRAQAANAEEPPEANEIRTNNPEPATAENENREQQEGNRAAEQTPPAHHHINLQA